MASWCECGQLKDDRFSICKTCMDWTYKRITPSETEANSPKLTMKEKLEILLEVIEKMSPEEVRNMYNEAMKSATNEDKEKAKSYAKIEKALMNRR